MKTTKRPWVLVLLPFVIAVESWFVPQADAQIADADVEGKLYFDLDVGAAFQQSVQIKEIGPLSLPASANLSAADVAALSSKLSALGISPVNNLVAGNYTINRPTIKFDPGLRFDLNPRYKITESISLGLESGLVYNNVDEVEASVTTPQGTVSGVFHVSNAVMYQVPVLANLVYRFPTKGRLKPYIGGGAGGVVTILDAPDYSQTDFTFGYEAMAGLLWEIDAQWDMGLGYKFLGTFDHTLGELKTDPTYTHSVLVTWTFKF